jgi:SAM-dependent methyltransferase
MSVRRFLKKLAWTSANPRPAWEGLLGRLRHPSYKYQVGPPELYETLGRHQFDLLRTWGLAPYHSLVDIGCGSLRAGQFFIRFLEARNYCGIDPNRQLVQEGIERNLEKGLLEKKRPRFRYDANFSLSAFSRTFDFLLAHSIFTHAPQHLIKKCLAEACKVISTTSLFFATYNKGAIDYNGDRWIAPGGDSDGTFHGHVTYTFARISALAEEVGLQCAEMDVVHPAGASWVAIYRLDAAFANGRSADRFPSDRF